MPGTLTQPVVSKEDVQKFADFCVYVRSIYQYSLDLYESGDDDQVKMMEKVAPILFGDLSHILVEYVILQVCKITDPAQDIRGNSNHTAEFLCKFGDFSTDPDRKSRLGVLAAGMTDFAKKLRPARNKLISHLDRDAVLADAALGAVSIAEWSLFWSQLQEFVHLLYDHVFQQPLDIASVAHTSEIPLLMKALRQSGYFERIAFSDDKHVSNVCAQVAFGEWPLAKA